jgi:hypothetical protein
MIRPIRGIFTRCNFEMNRTKREQRSGLVGLVMSLTRRSCDQVSLSRYQAVPAIPQCLGAGFINIPLGLLHWFKRQCLRLPTGKILSTTHSSIRHSRHVLLRSLINPGVACVWAHLDSLKLFPWLKRYILHSAWAFTADLTASMWPAIEKYS